MKYFGRRLRTGERTDTPVGQSCQWCEEEIAEGDSGVIVPGLKLDESTEEVIFHRECFLRQIFGSVGHQQKRCSCFGGDLEDPPELSRRQAAQESVGLWTKANGRMDE